MKVLTFFVLLSICNYCLGQKLVVLDTSMFNKVYRGINVSKMSGWTFHKGHDINWAEKEIDTTGWQETVPTALPAKFADKNGRSEGWFRFRFKLDSSFMNIPLVLHLDRWVAMDAYLNGNYLGSGGSTGRLGKPYRENNSNIVTLGLPLNLRPGEEYILAIHAVDHISPLNPYKNKSEVDNGIAIGISSTDILLRVAQVLQEVSVYFTIYASVCCVLCILFWFLYFQNRTERTLLVIALGMSFFSLQMVLTTVYAAARSASFFKFSLSSNLSNFFGSLFVLSIFFIFREVLKKKFPIWILYITAALLIIPSLLDFFAIPNPIQSLGYFFFLIYGAMLVSARKNLKGAQWAVVVGAVATLVFAFLFSLQSLKYVRVWPFPYCYELIGGIFLSFPLSLMAYVAMRFKEILTEVRVNAQQVIQLSEEKKEQAIRQQKILEDEVARQTVELRTSLDNLKATQAQLIQSEKMASLGELTAGIAHEIQNPLNFINNFADINSELADEMDEAIAKKNLDEVGAIAADIKANQERIREHGLRADSIVKGMLQHSRSSSGVKEETDINKLADEYLRLAYHGMRAKDKTFNAELLTEYDERLSSVSVVPQEIGRVLLNLINNAFYAVNERAHKEATNYFPVVRVSTSQRNGSVEVKVEDNGSGIPDKVRTKIFQPFFTTKPTGQGTGLGLSLAYDVIKSHGGQIEVQSTEGWGTVFTILLPGN